ncbi:helix-turn-helix transcriptional regulator [Citricoccus sp. GCM10030269]|uniref:helix-turn-helix transcriptional regulator n=1 Tax=Citricoccus sp. GCM10030269 TaxID=3273388 RepID=UPI00361DA679
MTGTRPTQDAPHSSFTVPSTERIVSLLWVLLTAGRGGVSREYLNQYVDGYAGATSAQARERMLTRDKEVLKDIGVPVETFTVQGEPGYEASDPATEVRYRIDHERMYLPHVSFSHEERLALVRAESAWAGSELGHAVVRAVGRVDAGEDWLDATAASDHQAFGSRLAGTDRHLTELADMVREQSIIAFDYRNANAQSPQRRTVRAWALTNPTGVWYLVGWDLDRGQQRTFRLTRFESEPRRLDGNSPGTPSAAPPRPADFNLNAVRDLISGESEPASTLLRLRPGRAGPLRVGADLLATAGGDHDGTEAWDELRVPYTRPGELAGSIAAAGPLATMPDHDDPVRAAVVRLLDDALEAHRAPVPEYTLSTPRRRRNRQGDRDKVATLIDAIGLMNRRGGIHRTELAERLHVEPRQLDRILDELRFCGMPERYFAGEQFDVLEEDGLVTIRQAERLSGPLRLSVPEAAALVIGLRAVTDIPGLKDTERKAATSALAKILDVSGPEVKGASEGIVAGFDFGAQTELAGQLHGAVRDRRVLSISYYSAASDQRTLRTVEPLRITSDGGYGYLQAWCRTQESVRNFRLDRIDTVTQTGEEFGPREVPSEGFHFGDHGDEQAVHVHFAHRIRDLATSFDPLRVDQLQDGSVVAEIRLTRRDYAWGQAARFGGEFRVLAPADLVESTLDWLQAARAGYVTHNSPSPDHRTAPPAGGVA